MPSLDAIHHSQHHVAAVVTAPDKPAGRGMKVRQSPVKTYAESNGIPVLQPHKLKDPEFIEALHALNADLFVVIAFRMLPESVWNMPPKGTINLHASLLPDYRGAAPINRAIMNGEIKTGVCTFFLKHEIDTGDLIDSETCEIEPEMNAGMLHDKLMQIGAALIVRTLDQIANGTVIPRPQLINTSEKTAPKIHTADCQINWTLSGREIYNQIRGLAPYPAAFTEIEQKHFRIYACRFEPDSAKHPPGSIEFTPVLRFACSDGWIIPLDVQMEGKKRMSAQDFLNGYRK